MTVTQLLILWPVSQFLTLGILAIHFAWSERKNSLEHESEEA